MMSVIERFLSKIRVSASGCWEYLEYKNKDGYGQFYHNKKQVLSHRFIYEYCFGDLNPDLTINHKCRNRACSNPIHLEQITIKENIMDNNSESIAKRNKEKTHCVHGHEFTPENIYIKSGARCCRKCIFTKGRDWKKNNRERHLQHKRDTYRRWKDKQEEEAKANAQEATNAS